MDVKNVTRVKMHDLGTIDIRKILAKTLQNDWIRPISVSIALFKQFSTPLN